MILVRDHIDDIVNTCFSPENVDILEFTQNQTKITIKDQFLYHYESACYIGTIEGLKKAIMYKIFQHQDLLLKIQDYRVNIRRILDLGEYSKVNLGYRDQLGTETSIGATGSKNDSENVQADQYSGVDQTENLNISDERTATSQTNVVEGIQVTIPQPEITAGETHNMDSYTAGDTVLLKGQIQYTKPKLNNAQIVEGDTPIGFQNLGKDVTTNQTNNTNTVTSSRGAEGRNHNKSLSSNTKTTGSKLDEITRNVEYVTNTARLKAWKTELPKLQLKFWNCFYNLFTYEQY